MMKKLNEPIWSLVQIMMTHKHSKELKNQFNNNIATIVSSSRAFVVYLIQYNKVFGAKSSSALIEKEIGF